jgi:hypothetical protein
VRRIDEVPKYYFVALLIKNKKTKKIKGNNND